MRRNHQFTTLLLTFLFLLQSVTCTERFTSWQQIRQEINENCKESFVVLDAFLDIVTDVDFEGAVEQYILNGFPPEFALLQRLDLPERILRSQNAYFNQKFGNFQRGHYDMKATLCRDANNWLQVQAYQQLHDPTYRIPVLTQVIKTPAESLEFRLLLDGPFEKIYHFSVLAEVLRRRASLRTVRSVLEAGAETANSVTIFDESRQVFKKAKLADLAKEAGAEYLDLLASFPTTLKPLYLSSGTASTVANFEVDYDDDGEDEQSQVSRRSRLRATSYLDEPVEVKAPRPKGTKVKVSCCCIA